MSFYNFLRYFANFVFYFSYGNNPWGIFHVCQHKINFLGFCGRGVPFLSVCTLDRMATEKMPKNAEKYMCEDCDFKCSKQSNYNNHLMTAKHKQATKEATNGNKWQQSENYLCECGRAYLHRASLYKHKKKCKENAENAENADSPPPPENIVRESINEVTFMKCCQMMVDTQADAAEQTRLLIEAISLNEPRSITNNNTTNNNNQFNLNVFLNEDCKDAFTLKEVINSIECTVMDLDRMDNDGYAATITRKILESIQNMSITERPIHCTDSRRNTVCVKDETGWEKNEKAMKLLVDSVYRVGRKLGSIVDDWKVAYPDHFRGTVSRREQYHRLIMDILKVSDLDVEGRIASKVCKGVVLDRKTAMM
jgi:hypothetical protein